jgi:uncharacterized protein YkwD
LGGWVEKIIDDVEQGSLDPITNPIPHRAPTPTATPGAPAIDSEDWRKDPALIERAVQDQVNIYRRAHGLQALQYREDIASISPNHSRFQATQEQIGHGGPNGQTVENRFANTDYLCGENILMRPRALSRREVYGIVVGREGDIFDMALDELAAELVQIWIGSPGHEQNMRDPNIELSGVGIHYNDSSEELYATHNLCFSK